MALPLRLFLLCALPGIVVGTHAGGARAQDTREASATAADDGPSAQDLYDKGIWYAEREAWLQAADRFREALKLEPSPGTRWQLARALVEAERWVEADLHVRRLLASDDVPADIRGEVEQLRASMDERAGRIHVAREGLPEGATVTIDGVALGADQVGVDVYVGPGLHEVMAFPADAGEAGEPTATRRVELWSGERKKVRFGSAPTAAEAARAVDAPDEGALAPGQRAQEESLARDWRLWAVLGAVLLVGAGLGVGLALGGGTEDPVEGSFEPGVIEWR